MSYVNNNNNNEEIYNMNCDHLVLLGESFSAVKVLSSSSFSLLFFYYLSTSLRIDVSASDGLVGRWSTDRLQTDGRASDWRKNENPENVYKNNKNIISLLYDDA